ncbi:hypothetical protein EV191_105121 [Tamaricihabitans halophyticus]|uniref:Uncharacterized protein n=1 Tax=Tamaricihabitans halophyticus TaxID=1262583 RepID=A0A4R2QVY6_9PSEU|nr:hypothetical protein EV191_105121 [Tamaricihabitans halophyticus]
MARTATGESVFSRVVRILEAFDPDSPSLLPSEIARRSGLHIAADRGTRPEGKKILMFLGAANRDPRQWTEADSFSLSRDAARRHRRPRATARRRRPRG